MRIKESLLENRKIILSLAQRYGVRTIKIFGSVARDQDTAVSDLDLLIEMDENRSLLEYISFQQALEDLLKCKVDLAEPQTLRPEFREQVLQEAIPL